MTCEAGDDNAVIEIKSGRVLGGKLPPRLLRVVNEWRSLHRFEIDKAWVDAQQMKNPKRIRPLE